VQAASARRIQIAKEPRQVTRLSLSKLNFVLGTVLQRIADGAEDHTNLRAEQRQNRDYDNGDQYENQSVLYETLTLFTR
jgi:hypothetical protein